MKDLTVRAAALCLRFIEPPKRTRRCRCCEHARSRPPAAARSACLSPSTLWPRSSKQVSRWGSQNLRGGSSDELPASRRVADFYSVGCRFESCWDRHSCYCCLSFQGLIVVFGKLGF